PPPAGFDWDAWVGPAPMRPYSANRGFYRFRWFYDYSGGQLTNFGVHYLAMIHWAMGFTAPKSVVAMGGKYADFDDREVPDTMEVLWTYPGEKHDVLVTFSQYNASAALAAQRSCEIEFRGTRGTMYFGSGGYEVVPEVILPGEVPARTPLDRVTERTYRNGGKEQIKAVRVKGDILNDDHVRNFLDGVKSRQPVSCDVEYGHRVTTAAQIANIAHRTRSYLEWDAAAEKFVGAPKADELLKYTYRAPLEFPEVV
ncbi:MAG: Gfo/Idh/MocA family protein, partial [Planctomycetia bacterium]